MELLTSLSFENKIFFSIIIPVYNTEKYLSECLDSCLQQDLPYDEYEIICVNDGSTDNSAQILEDYRLKHKNIIVINQPNQGVSVARNKGIEIAKGEYIWFVDADDLIQENVLYQLKCSVEQDKKVSFHFKKYDFNEELTSEEQEMKRNKMLFQNSRDLRGFVTTKLYQKKAIISANIYFAPGILMGQDELFEFEFSKNYGDPKIIDIVAYLYRINILSVTHGRDEKQRAKKRADALTKQILLLYDEQKAETGKTREKTIWFMFARRLSLFKGCLNCLPFKDFISELIKAKKSGVFSINHLAKEVKIDRKLTRRIRPIVQNRLKYFYKEKVLVNIERLRHPFRTIKNLKNRK